MIPPTTLAQALRAAAPFPGGPTFNILCQAIANAVVSWLPLGVSIRGVTAGAVGAGTVTGTMMFTGTPPAVLAAIGSSLRGQTAPQLATVIAVGLTTGLMGMTYTGVSTGVATGTDVSLVVSANSTALSSTLRTVHSGLCAAQGGSGAQAPGFYEAIANGIVVVVSTGVTIPPTGVVAPTGPVGPSSSVGTSVSVPV